MSSRSEFRGYWCRVSLTSNCTRLFCWDLETNGCFIIWGLKYTIYIQEVSVSVNLSHFLQVQVSTVLSLLVIDWFFHFRHVRSGLLATWEWGYEWLRGENFHVPERNSDMDLVDSLLGELDFQIKKLEWIRREQEAEERRLQTGADYSWLVTHWPKSYELPAMQRLELEQLCHKVRKERPLLSGKMLIVVIIKMTVTTKMTTTIIYI